MPQGLSERLIAGVLIAGSCLGCSNMNNTQKGAVGTRPDSIPRAACIIGKQLGSTGGGAAIGARHRIGGGRIDW